MQILAARRRGEIGKRIWLGLACTAMIVIGGSVPDGAALALECPVAEVQPNQHVLRESQQRIEELSELLSTGDVANRMGEIVTEMRRTYPAVTDAELVNYFVTAYCPVVNSMGGLSDDEKRSRLDRFSGQVFQAVEAGS
ncbi:MAG: hypothetical protein GY791_07535 [Alphaproteobacteria bacterium]|nr:hypothetical protein [Alphaproteobacteria bacterium]